jgi:hypothetical protein
VYGAGWLTANGFIALRQAAIGGMNQRNNLGGSIVSEERTIGRDRRSEMIRATFLGISFGCMGLSFVLWMFGIVSPRTGPYWYFYATMAAIFAILYSGTKENDK